MTIAEYALTHFDGQMADVRLIAGQDDVHRFSVNDDGSLTIYTECVFEDSQAARELELKLVCMPIRISEGAAAAYDSSARERAVIPMTFQAVNVIRYTCNERMDFPAAGVRITRVTMIATPLEIQYEIVFEISDLDAYQAQHGGLWFEFIDPDRKDAAWAEQRVSDSWRSSGSIGRADGRHKQPDEVGTVYRQRGSIGLDAIGGQYTIRPYNAWSKDRYEAKTFSVAEE